jgi:hypothetical protein
MKETNKTVQANKNKSYFKYYLKDTN